MPQTYSSVYANNHRICWVDSQRVLVWTGVRLPSTPPKHIWKSMFRWIRCVDETEDLDEVVADYCSEHDYLEECTIDLDSVLDKDKMIKNFHAYFIKREHIFRKIDMSKVLEILESQGDY